MAERAAGSCGAAGSSGAAPPQPPAGAEPSAGGACPAAERGASESGPREKKADPEQCLNPPDITATRKNINPRETTRATPRRKSKPNTSLRRSPREPTPQRLSPWKSSPRKDQTPSYFNLSPRRLVTSPQAKRRSWCRSSLKGTKGRKSLPPVHQDVAELSKSISLDLPEVDRLSVLLLSSFQFSARKLEDTLKDADGFNPEAFKAHVESVSEDLKRYLQKLKEDGTLQSCVEDPKGISVDSAVEESVAQVKEHMTSFTEESRSWDELLQRYKESAEEMSRQLERRRLEGGRAEPTAFLQMSQARALGSKPDYRKVLDDQREVLSSMELVLDGLQQTATLLQTFSEDSRRYLERQSKEMAARTFQHLEQSPVRKLIAGPPRKTLPPKA